MTTAESIPERMSKLSCQQWLGTVIAVQANYYSVQLDPSPQLGEAFAKGGQACHGRSARLLCIRRGLLKKLGQQIMAGDRVVIEEPDWQGMRGAIASVCPRQNFLDRPPIANVNQVLLLFAVSEPTLEAHQLSRFLVKAESTGLEIVLCINKRDLVTAQVAECWLQRITHWGYSAWLLSIQRDEQLPPGLIAQMQDKITVLAGPSGAGKSSLANRLLPNQELRISSVSGKLGRGRHTTRHVELFELANGGFIADTPGFNQPDFSLAPEALGGCFPEIRKKLSEGSCQFSNCLHRDEPGCIVRGDWERYEHYLSWLAESIEQQRLKLQQSEAEATAKVKTLEAGKVLHEPRLEAKKYRRTSRKTRNQAFQELCLDVTSAEGLEALEDLEDLGL